MPRFTLRYFIIIVIPSSYFCLLFEYKDNEIIGKKILKFKSCEQFS